MASSVHSQQIIRLFNQTFKECEKAELVGGANEPLYVPYSEQQAYAQVIFTYDYTSSALHEIAHWCIAGKARRKQLDYGYWYAPEGRNIEQQQAFYQVEVKPQALEWIFSNACGHVFQVSCDNFLEDEKSQQDKHKFLLAVTNQVQEYANKGLPKRAGMFTKALMDYYAVCSNPFVGT